LNAPLTSAIEERQLRDAAGAVMTVNISAIRRNYRLAKAQVGPDVTVSAVIKADGYGLGAVRLARLLREEGCKEFFVARAGEAVALRKAMRAENAEQADGVAVFVLDGLLPHADPQLLIEHKIIPVINSLEQLHAWNDAGRRRGERLPAILQFDTGMSRAGLSPAERQTLLADKDARLSHVKPLLVMSHLAKAGDISRTADGRLVPGPATQKQLAAFNEVRQQFPTLKATLSASTGIFLGPEFHMDMVRVGGVMHGMAPFDADSNPLEPVVHVKSHIAQTRQIQEGDQIGYGLNYTAAAPMLVGVLPIGFADGVNRVRGGNRPNDPPLSAAVQVGENAHVAPIVGAMSMDMTTVDLTRVPFEELGAGARVDLVNDRVTQDHFGAQFGTIPAEFEAKVAKRVHKDFLVEPSDKHNGRPHTLARPVDATPSPFAWSTEPVAGPAAGDGAVHFSAQERQATEQAVADARSAQIVP
jgi:alanine racemase